MRTLIQEINKKYIMDGANITPEMQIELNKPLADQKGLNPENRDFLQILIALIDNKKIDTLRPGSLINQNLYATFDPPTQAKIDLEAMNMLSAVREIENLYRAGYAETFQMHYLVDKLRVSKQRLEDVSGDIFII